MPVVGNMRWKKAARPQRCDTQCVYNGDGLHCERSAIVYVDCADRTWFHIVACQHRKCVFNKQGDCVPDDNRTAV